MIPVPTEVLCDRNSFQLTTPDPIELTTDGIVQYMKSFQIGPEKTTDTILSPDNLSIQLVGRDNTIAEIADIFETSYQYQVEGIPDRTKKIIPLITSIPGMGKTRLLYEWKNFIPKDPNNVPIIITYGNGHSITETEKCLSPESSLCWRILFALFLERFRSNIFFDRTSSELPKNIADLRLKHVLSVIQSFYDVSKRLVIFLGIDEYQALRQLPKQGEKSALTTLLELLINYSMSGKIVILPLFVGTAFSSSSGSSGAVCRYVPLRLLSSKEVFSAIRSIKKTNQLLKRAPARRHLFSLGGVPRYFVNYVERVLEQPTIGTEVMDDAFLHVQTEWVDFWNSHFNSSQLVDRKSTRLNSSHT